MPNPSPAMAFYNPAVQNKDRHSDFEIFNCELPFFPTSLVVHKRLMSRLHGRTCRYCWYAYRGSKSVTHMLLARGWRKYSLLSLCTLPESVCTPVDAGNCIHVWTILARKYKDESFVWCSDISPNLSASMFAHARTTWYASILLWIAQRNQIFAEGEDWGMICLTLWHFSDWLVNCTQRNILVSFARCLWLTRAVHKVK